MDRSKELPRLLLRIRLVTGRERPGYAVVHVVVEDGERERLERGVDRGDLREDVDAVAVVLDHSLDPPHLSFDPMQALDEVGLSFGVAVGHMASLIERNRRRRRLL